MYRALAKSWEPSSYPIHAVVLTAIHFWLFIFAAPLEALDRTWIGGNANWDTSTSNWSPADEPDSDDRAIFNTGNFVFMTINQTLEGLFLSGGMNLSTGTQFANVNGTIDLDDANTLLTVHTNALLGGTPPVTSINADDIIVTGGAEFRMANDVTIHDTSNLGGSDADFFGTMTVGAGSTLSGNGRLLFNNSLSSSIVLLQNNGTISALSYGNPGFFSSETLWIDAPDTDARIDLDGISDSSVVNVFREQTLDMNIQQTDDFDGTINLFHNTVLDFAHDWELNGVMDVENGFIAGTPPLFPDIPAGDAVVAGGKVTMNESDSRINVVHNDGTLQLDAELDANDGVIDNNGHLIFNAAADIGASVDFLMEFDADLTVNDSVIVHDTDWNWDDNGGGNNDITINDFGFLSAQITAPGASVFSGDMHIVGGSLLVQGDNNNWEQTGGNITFEGTSIGSISGDQFIMTAGTFRVVAGANGDVSSTTFWDAGTLDVDGILKLNGGVDWSGTSVVGDGVLEQNANAVVTQSTTIAVATYDWDASITTILPGVTFTVDVDSIDPSDGIFGSTINLNSGTLDVTIADAQWRVGLGGVLNITDSGTDPTITGGSDLRLVSNATINFFGAKANINTPLIVQETSLVEIEDSNGFLDINAQLTLAGGEINRVVGAGNTRINFDSLLVTGDSSVTLSRFNWDSGPTVIESGGTLDINVTRLDQIDDVYDGTSITMNSGDIDVNTGSNNWTMAGTLNMNNSDDNEPVLSGEEVQIAGPLNVGGTGISVISADINFVSGANVNVAANSLLRMTGTDVFFNDGVFTGDGIIAPDATTTRFSSMTISMPSGVFDLDGISSGSDRLLVEGNVTLNVAGIEVNGIREFNNDEIEIEPAGQLNIDLPGEDGWVMNGVLDLHGDTGPDNFAVQLDGDDVELRGTVDVVDQAQIDARVDITGTINLTTAGTNLRLVGGFLDPNRIEGGIINGPGRLSSSGISTLQGFGAINSDVAFVGPNPILRADDGELTINGAILDVGTIGSTADGILNITNPWNTNAAGVVSIGGGELRGALVTNNNLSELFFASGLITAPVVNESRITSSGPLTIVDNNLTDYDGTSNNGALEASGGDFTIHRDTSTGSTINFNGTIEANNGSSFVLNNV
ncbi:MAG: beta strand repeat-containing protein, partial [Aeoliella sp.]